MDAAAAAVVEIAKLELELLELLDVTNDGLTCANNRLKSFNVVGLIGPNRSEAKLCRVRPQFLFDDVCELQSVPLVHDRRFIDSIACKFSSVVMAIVVGGDDDDSL